MSISYNLHVWYVLIVLAFVVSLGWAHRAPRG